MPRFFFNTADGKRVCDEVGEEFPNLSAARRHAIEFAGSLLTFEPQLLDDSQDFKVEVTDERGLVLLVFTVIETQAPVSMLPSFP